MAKQPDPISPEVTPSVTEGYLTAKEAAERMELSVEAVRAMCNDGSLSGAVRQQGRWHVPSDTVEAWRSGQSTKSSSSKDSMAPTTKVVSATPKKEPGPPAWWQRFRYNPWVFYPTAMISTLIVLVGVLFGLIQAGADFGAFSRQVKEWGLVREFPAEREGETLIVISRFYHSEGVADTEAHNEIRNAIQAAAEEIGESNLRVALSATQIAADDRTRAAKLGKRYDASIVIWGADTGVRVSVNFLNLKHPDFYAAAAVINETQRTQISNPDAYTSFITRDLPGQLSFLSFFAVGQSYYAKVAYTDSIEAIEKAVAAAGSADAIPEGMAEAYFRLGWLYQLTDQCGRALENYTKAIELNPQDPDAYNNRGNVYNALGNRKAAIQDFNRAIELAPQLAVAYTNRGIVRIGEGDMSAGTQDFEKAIELDPQFAGAYGNRGIGRAAQGDLEGAIQDYIKAIELNPEDAMVFYNRGNAHRAQGDLAQAVQDYDKAIELIPQLAEAYNNRCIAHADLGDFGAAIEDCTKAIELNPQLAEAFVNRGSVRKAQGDLVGAIQDYTKAVELNPQDATAYFNRGTLLGSQNKPALAIQDLDKAIELNPQYGSAYCNRGIARKLLGDRAGAIADFRRYLELNPNAPDRQQIEASIADLEKETANP